MSCQMVHGWLIKAMPELITRSCLVDPVCFCAFSLPSSSSLTHDRSLGALCRLRIPLFQTQDVRSPPCLDQS